jgi:hypothetical protein
VLGGGALVGALGVVLFGVLGGALPAGGVFWSAGAGGAAVCSFEQPAAIMSAAIATRTKLRFMRAPLSLARTRALNDSRLDCSNKNGSRAAPFRLTHLRKPCSRFRSAGIGCLSGAALRRTLS